MKVQARMEDKVRIKNLKSLFEFFEKFGRDMNIIYSREFVWTVSKAVILNGLCHKARKHDLRECVSI